MKRPIHAALILIALMASSRADVATSQNYALKISSIDAGGSRVTSAVYAQNLVIGTLAGRSTTAGGVTMQIGFAGELNTAPVAGDDLRSHPQGAAVDIPGVALFANDFDPDDDTFSLLSVDPASANGGQVTLVGQTIHYSPPAALSGTDQFKYVIADSNGDIATATVTMVTAPPVENQPLNSVIFTQQADGKILIRFRQQPGWTEYHIEIAHDLKNPDWQMLQVFHAGADGIVELLIDPPTAPQTYFRGAVY